MNKIASQIQKQWVHSHEEDSASEMVFRPATFAFPRSRGRVAFELKPDHSLVETGLAPSDGPQMDSGKWELTPDSKLIFYKESPNQPIRTLQIASAGEDRLVVRKEPAE